MGHQSLRFVGVVWGINKKVEAVIANRSLRVMDLMVRSNANFQEVMG